MLMEQAEAKREARLAAKDEAYRKLLEEDDLDLTSIPDDDTDDVEDNDDSNDGLDGWAEETNHA